MVLMQEPVVRMKNSNIVVSLHLLHVDGATCWSELQVGIPLTGKTTEAAGMGIRVEVGLHCGTQHK